MNWLIIRFLTVCFWVVGNTSPEPALSTLVLESFYSGKAEILRPILNNYVDYNSGNRDIILSRNQLVAVLEKFFATHKPDKFTLTEVNERQNFIYCIGYYKSGTNRFSIIMVFAIKDNSPQMYQLKIEPVNEQF